MSSAVPASKGGETSAVEEVEYLDEIDLGPMRGVHAAAEVEVTLSAESQAEINVGSSERVPFQIEPHLGSDAAGGIPARPREGGRADRRFVIG